MLEAGATAYVVKQGAFQELATALQAVVANKVYISPSVAAPVVEGFVREGTPRCGAGPCTLSPRERDVLQLVAEGKATKQVAMELHVSVKTVETHRRNIMEKLEFDSVADLTKYAIREGMTTVDH